MYTIGTETKKGKDKSLRYYGYCRTKTEAELFIRNIIRRETKWRLWIGMTKGLSKYGIKRFDHYLTNRYGYCIFNCDPTTGKPIGHFMAYYREFETEG